MPPINRHFAPKSKVPFQNNYASNEQPQILIKDSKHKNQIQRKNVQRLETKTNNINMHQTKNPFMRQKKFDRVHQNEQDTDSYNPKRFQNPYTQRKAKLENLRQSIQGLQKIIQKSQQVLNESSFHNSTFKNPSVSPKHRIKSDSLQLKFNFSTKKMNQRKLQEQKLTNLLKNTAFLEKKYRSDLNQDYDKNKNYRQNLLQQSIQRQNNQPLESKYANHFDNLKIQTPRDNQPFLKQTNKRNPFLRNQRSLQYQSQHQHQIKTPNQLNSTLQKLLNQSFESTAIHGQTLTLNTPSTTFTGQSPKWFQSEDFKILNRLKQRNAKIQLKNTSIQDLRLSLEQTPRQNIDFNLTKISKNGSNQQYHDYDEAFPHIYLAEASFNQTQKDFSHVKDDILINQDISQESKWLKKHQDKIQADQESISVYNIQNFTTKSRNSYHGQMKIHDSYLKDLNRIKNNNNRKQPQMEKQPSIKKMALKTPKAYHNYQQNCRSSSKSKQKSWFPKNYNEFQRKVLRGQVNQNVFKQTPFNQGKFSPRLICQNKQNINVHTPAVRNELNSSKYETDQKRQFIKDVWKYPFVERYLKQSDIFSIYDKLKKSNIPKHKWIIFVVDQVQKKMKLVQLKQ